MVGHLFSPRILACLSFGLCLSGCYDGTAKWIDRIGFELVGGTLVESPSLVTLKQIHFDVGSILGQSVVVSGSLVRMGEFGTHLLLEDDSARLLVVMTDLDPRSSWVRTRPGQRVRILGTVERGKKGLPYLQARAVGPIEG